VFLEQLGRRFLPNPVLLRSCQEVTFGLFCLDCLFSFILGVANQTTQALHNIMGALEWGCVQASNLNNACKIDWRWQIAKCRVYLAALSSAEQVQFDSAWVSFFKSEQNRTLPARMAFQGALLVIDARVEIECDAYFNINFLRQ
jgi:enamine deaminase RidA (YjgF/YER057c/UK114 family)